MKKQIGWAVLMAGGVLFRRDRAGRPRKGGDPAAG